MRGVRTATLGSQCAGSDLSVVMGLGDASPLSYRLSRCMNRRWGPLCTLSNYLTLLWFQCLKHYCRLLYNWFTFYLHCINSFMRSSMVPGIVKSIVYCLLKRCHNMSKLTLLLKRWCNMSKLTHLLKRWCNMSKLTLSCVDAHVNYFLGLQRLILSHCSVDIHSRWTYLYNYWIPDQILYR